MLFHDWWRTAYMALHSDFPPDPSYDLGPDKMTRLPTKVSEKPDAQGQDIHIQRAYVPRPSPSFGKRLDCCTGPAAIEHAGSPHFGQEFVPFARVNRTGTCLRSASMRPQN